MLSFNDRYKLPVHTSKYYCVHWLDAFRECTHTTAGPDENELFQRTFDASLHDSFTNIMHILYSQ